MVRYLVKHRELYFTFTPSLRHMVSLSHVLRPKFYMSMSSFLTIKNFVWTQGLQSRLFQNLALSLWNAYLKASSGTKGAQRSWRSMSRFKVISRTGHDIIYFHFIQKIRRKTVNCAWTPKFQLLLAVLHLESLHVCVLEWGSSQYQNFTSFILVGLVQWLSSIKRKRREYNRVWLHASTTH